MKFGKSIGSQQENSELHYVDYKVLKKSIKEVVVFQRSHELAEALTANSAFEEMLVGEIGQVNSCFSKSQQDLLQRIGVLAEDLESCNFSSGSAPSQSSQDVQTEETSRGKGRVFDRSRPAAFRTLVSILREVDLLRKYAVWNAVAIVKILKKRRKQTSFGLEDLTAERAGWLSRQVFFSGSDFAELHAAIESLGHMLVLSELAPGVSASLPHERELQQCPICLEQIADMVELSCRHRFCWKCFVLGPIAHQPGEYRITQCPICRKETTQSDAAAASDDGREGSVIPTSEGMLSRFLHTYFRDLPQEDVEREEAEQEARRDGEQDEREIRDVVGELVKALLSDVNWQQPADASAASSSQPGPFASHHAPGDFFKTLPPQKPQDTQLIGTAQKLQWLRLASTGDPLAVDGATYCSLCSEPLLMEEVVTTPCKHYFHKVCILRIDLPQCPLCSGSLPLSWFLPPGHPSVEHGFRVIAHRHYRPNFPGGPSRGSCGYPLRKPPPISLHCMNGMVMKSYLHRVLPAGDEFDSSSAPSPVSVLSPELRPVDHPADDAGSSASESSSEDSGSDDGCIGGLGAERRKARAWVWSAVGRMRHIPDPAFRDGCGVQSLLPRFFAPVDTKSGRQGSVDFDQRNSSVLLRIDDHV